MKALDEIKARADEVEDGTKQYTIGQAFMVTRRSQGDVPKLLAALDAVREIFEESPSALHLIDTAITDALR